MLIFVHLLRCILKDALLYLEDAHMIDCLLFINYMFFISKKYSLLSLINSLALLFFRGLGRDTLQKPDA